MKERGSGDFLPHGIHSAIWKNAVPDTFCHSQSIRPYGKARFRALSARGNSLGHMKKRDSGHFLPEGGWNTYYRNELKMRPQQAGHLEVPLQ